MGATDGLIVYNFTTIEGAVQAIDAATGSMRSTLQQLETDLRPLETDAWTSQAQQAYKARKDRWNAAANDITRILGQVKMALETSADRMRSTDQRAATRF